MIRTAAGGKETTVSAPYRSERGLRAAGGKETTVSAPDSCEKRLRAAGGKETTVSAPVRSESEWCLDVNEHEIRPTGRVIHSRSCTCEIASEERIGLCRDDEACGYCGDNIEDRLIYLITFERNEERVLEAVRTGEML